MSNVLIVGAGPVGLTAAIELTRQGANVCIIDKQAERQSFSKALAINAHTLQLLEAANVTASLLEAGLKLQAACFNIVAGKSINLDFRKIKQRYNFILILPQYETETILEQHLNKLGVYVERNAELLSFTQDAQSVTAKIKRGDNQSEYNAAYLIGADGAHSTVRHCAELNFTGKTYVNEWYLADIQVAEDYPSTKFQLHILPNNQLMVLIPIKPRLFRIISNHEILLEKLPHGFKVEKIQWQSAFKINCRQVDAYQKERVFLAGDAAHIHSPAGGRGMNLGMEDAVILAYKMVNNNLADYTQLRAPAGRRVIIFTDFITRMMTQRNHLVVFLRNWLVFPLLKIPFFQKQMIKNILGIK